MIPDRDERDEAFESWKQGIREAEDTEDASSDEDAARRVLEKMVSVSELMGNIELGGDVALAASVPGDSNPYTRSNLTLESIDRMIQGGAT